MRVYVKNLRNQPLMPTTPKKARQLLRAKKARVVQREPFTIQLLYPTGETKQAVTLGVDAGTKHMGLSATTDKETLYEAEVSLRTDITDLLSIRRQYRSVRRNRKTRYRKPRFNNRKRGDKWLAPSIRNRINTHIKLVSLVSNILPVKETIVEVAQFDIQKIKNPNIQGVEYQQGEQLNFWNVREYVLFRDKHTCQHCKGKSKDKILNVHHIRSRKTHGDRPNNLITLCETCHKKIHTEKLEHLFKPRDKGFRAEAQMTIMRWFIYRELKETYPGTKLTYGYITKNTRIANNLEKSHIIDARCISGNPTAKPPSHNYFIKQVRKNNRQLHKATILKGGIRKANKAPYIVKGFRLFDKVKFNNKECFIFGRRATGYFDLRLLDGTKIHASASYKKLTLLEKSKTLLTKRRKAISSPLLKQGVSIA